MLDLISYKTEDGDLVEMAVIKKIKSSGLFHVKGSKESFSFTEDGMDLLTYNVDPLTFELPMLVETSKLLNPIYFVDADMMFPNNPGSFYLNFFGGQPVRRVHSSIKGHCRAFHIREARKSE